MVFRDQLNRSVSIPHPPKRIISLVPSQTELLFDLGLDEEVVGITKFCVRPPEMFRLKQRVGGTKNVKLDSIRKLQPDLILANKEENDREQIETLATEFPVWISDIKTLEDALEMIRSVGQLIDKEVAAKVMVASIQEDFQKLSKAQLAPLPAAYFIWREPYMVAGRDTFIHHLMERAGFKNIFGHMERYPIVELEQLPQYDLKALLLPSEPFPFKEKHTGDFTSVCPQAAIRLVDGELFSWYGSRLLHAASYFLNLRVTLEE